MKSENVKKGRKFIKICGTQVDMIQIPEVIKSIEEWIENREVGNYIVVSNANDIFLSIKNKDIQQAINNSSLSVPDGISLVWVGKFYGYSLKRRVYGPELMLKFMEIAEEKGYTNFFYGSTPNTLELVYRNLKRMYPRLNIRGMYSPPFSPKMELDYKGIEIINRVSPDVLWVGLGCPKQQLWMHKHKDRLKVPVMVGVGAAFDFLAGTKPQAPSWIGDYGFEWLFRLITEPKRLWRRYLAVSYTHLTLPTKA